MSRITELQLWLSNTVKLQFKCIYILNTLKGEWDSGGNSLSTLRIVILRRSEERPGPLWCHALPAPKQSNSCTAQKILQGTSEIWQSNHGSSWCNQVVLGNATAAWLLPQQLPSHKQAWGKQPKRKILGSKWKTSILWRAFCVTNLQQVF